MKTKRTEITIETERMLFISSPRKAFGWCAACGTEAEMVSVDEAAILRRVDSRTIFRWVEAERVHSSETANGLLLICLNSTFDEGQGLGSEPVVNTGLQLTANSTTKTNNL